MQHWLRNKHLDWPKFEQRGYKRNDSRFKVIKIPRSKEKQWLRYWRERWSRSRNDLKNGWTQSYEEEWYDQSKK